MYYSRTENERGEKELLSFHLKKAAEFAKQFAKEFGEGEAGELCGLFHDAGKASEMFQDVLLNKEHGVNHEAAGAFFLLNMRFLLLSRVVFAHHKGLCWDIENQLMRSYNEKDSFESHSENRRFSVSGKEQYDKVYAYMIKEIGIPKTKPIFNCERKSFYNNLPGMLHARMLLSCLADADYTASAMHYNTDIYDKSTGECLNPEQILNSLELYRQNVKKNSAADSKINDIRDKVYQSCINAAENNSGLFTLTAPTGTGKTLALLAFAAKHAQKHNKSRIIIILPYLSIISQNAKIYKEICGNVLEAHSMVSYDEQTKLYSERWSASLIITTSVKFFESLFKSKPSDLRFLHSIANSVVIFDEAQSIPAELTGTTVESVGCLCEMFKCSVVFSTATQPVFSERSDIKYNPVEIVGSIDELYRNTERVKIKWLINTAVSFEIIAEEMTAANNVCCVVNRKDHAYKLFGLLKNLCNTEECFHISTDMCKEHRDNVIKKIAERLIHNQPCRLVSTSCIEAGVDLDFAYMYRALAPLDSIIQCAGRCNRNGTKAGLMTVFVPDEEKLYPSDLYANSANCVKLISYRHEININNPEHIKEYYNELFKGVSHDKAMLCKAIENYDFEETEKHYRFIQSDGVNVLVPYEGKITLFNRLAYEAVNIGITNQWMKEAAPICVTSYRVDKLKDICEKCAIKIHGSRKSLCNSWYILRDEIFYDKSAGLHFDDDSRLNYLI